MLDPITLGEDLKVFCDGLGAIIRNEVLECHA